ncbi:MAG TPA: DUF2953 domain-containing protein [Bacillales bacterium]|nr:DUF2953 domain-containing protein [Bacillales bacterium]
MVAYAALIAVVIGLFALLCSRLYVEIQFCLQDQSNDMTITMRVWGIKVYSRHHSVDLNGYPAKEGNESAKKEKSGLDESLKLTQRMVRKLENAVAAVRRFASKVTFVDFAWHSRIGCADAAVTGMTAGSLWALKGNALGVLDRFFQWKTEPELSVEPLWQKQRFETTIACMFSFRIGHAMLAARRIFKSLKGGNGDAGTATGTSDSRVDEHRA